MGQEASCRTGAAISCSAGQCICAWRTDLLARLWEHLLSRCDYLGGWGAHAAMLRGPCFAAPAILRSTTFCTPSRPCLHKAASTPTFPPALPLHCSRLDDLQAVSSLRRELEAAYKQLSTAEAEASEARASAGRSAMLALEMARLQEDNAVLAERLEQMADDLK